jgi:hypothetical protein
VNIPPFVIILILILAPMILGALLKMFKAYQEEADRQSQRRRTRPTSVPTVPVSTSAAGTGRGTGEIDRFLQEIDKLRQKADQPVKVAPVRAVPVAKAKPRVEPAPFVTTAPVAPVRTITTDVPVARVVAPAPAAAPALRPTPILGSTAPKVTVRQQAAPTSPFGKDLAALLGSNKSVALAVVLQEVLGPPKCKRT